MTAGRNVNEPWFAMRGVGDRLLRVLPALVVLTLLIALSSACRGPERAPHQPIDGVDRPAEAGR